MNKKRTISERLNDPHDDLPSMEELEDEFAKEFLIGLILLVVVIVLAILL